MNKIFRCPNCKAEEKETIYLKIKEIYCKKCKMQMIQIYLPTNLHLKKEMELNKKEQIN